MQLCKCPDELMCAKSKANIILRSSYRSLLLPSTTSVGEHILFLLCLTPHGYRSSTFSSLRPKVLSSRMSTSSSPVRRLWQISDVRKRCTRTSALSILRSREHIQRCERLVNGCTYAPLDSNFLACYARPR